MIEIIRFMAQERDDLYILIEKARRELVINKYPEGRREILTKMDDYFGEGIARIPLASDGLEEWVFKAAIELGANIKEEEEEEEEAKRFYDRFINEVYLRVNEQLPWEYFVKRNANQLNANYKSKEHERLTKRLIEMIKTCPQIIGLHSNKRSFYEEVNLTNKLSNITCSSDKFTQYLKGSKLKPAGRIILSATDLVYIDPARSYLIEIKISNKKSGNQQKRAMRRQLLLAGHFMYNNYRNIPVTLVGVEYRGKEGSEKLCYRHFTFNPETRELDMTVNSGF